MLSPLLQATNFLVNVVVIVGGWLNCRSEKLFLGGNTLYAWCVVKCSDMEIMNATPDEGNVQAWFSERERKT